MSSRSQKQQATGQVTLLATPPLLWLQSIRPPSLQPETADPSPIEAAKRMHMRAALFQI